MRRPPSRRGQTRASASSMRSVGQARGLAVWDGRDRRAHLRLDVALDRRLRRAAAFFAPDERHRRARLAVLGVDDREREHLAFVRAVAAPGGHADGPAVPRHLVIWMHRIDSRREFDELAPALPLELAADDPHHVFSVEDERDLLAMAIGGAFLERLAADEVMVELQNRSVAEIPRR